MSSFLTSFLADMSPFYAQYMGDILFSCDGYMVTLVLYISSNGMYKGISDGNSFIFSLIARPFVNIGFFFLGGGGVGVGVASHVL